MGMSTVKLQFLVTSLAVGVLAGCASGPATQYRVSEEPTASEYRHITGSHIRRDVPVGVRYLDSMHRVRVIDQAEMRETGSNNVAEILYRSGVF
jgi:hypothetical protein